MLEKIQQYLTKTVTILLQFILLVALIRIFVFAPGLVDGQSMENSFYDNDIFLVNKIVYLIRTPKRFEVVQFFDPLSKDKLVIKRVVGLPGETIFFRSNGVFIRTTAGGEIMLNESYLDLSAANSIKSGQYGVVTIAEHSYYVLGDNRLYSTDSSDFGPVHRKQITGKVINL